MINPHTKFEVNRLKHFQVIAQKPFSDGDTRNLVAIFKTNLSLSISNPHTKFEVNRSWHSRVIAWKTFSDGGIWWHQAAPFGARFRKEPSSVHE